MGDGEHSPFQGLDFVYMPSTDVAGDVEYFTSVLGAGFVFAIEAFGTRVAMVTLSDDPPALLFAGHLAGERPILVYRVDDLDRAMKDLEARGWEPQPRFGIPHGPVCAFRTPFGHRLAIYELTRPRAAEHLAGRRDF
jgi:catechol 2,3-dioxygenase-like lactoylglutathione lyase family enzyme